MADRRSAEGDDDRAAHPAERDVSPGAGVAAAGTDPDVDAPVDASIDALDHVVVVGYDAWTEPVLTQLAARDVSYSVITTDGSPAAGSDDPAVTVVETDDVDEACFEAAGIDRADAVLVATLDDQLNVLAVLTVMNVDDAKRVVTFAGEAQDVSKLRAAGADHVVSLGASVAELLVEVALSERAVEDVLAELVGTGSH